MLLLLWTLLAESGGSIKLTNPIMGSDMPSPAGFGGIWITASKAILALSSVGAVVMLIWAGFTWLTAGGEKEKISSAQQTLVWVLLGLLVIIGAYAFLNTLIGTLVGQLGFTS